METIYFWVNSLNFRNKANDRAYSIEIKCNNSKNCEAFKMGTCVLLRNQYGSNPSCPYGEKITSFGFTQRAKNFYSWINKEKESKGGEKTGLKAPKERITSVGDYFYLPYSRIRDTKDIEFSGYFLDKKLLNSSTLTKILEFRPLTWFNDEIPSYKREDLPKFVNDLKLFQNDLFNELIKDCPKALVYVKNKDLIGRSVILKTINKNVEVIHKDEKWIWDGENLKTKEKQVHFLDLEYQEISVSIKPTDSTTIKVSSEDQINSKTIFID